MAPSPADQPILHLSGAEVTAHLPSPPAGVELGRRALIAIADGAAQLPPKPTVHPRDDGFAHAMPAYLGDGDLLGIKWVASYAGNARVGAPTINGLMLLSDGATGLPVAVMDAAALTGSRTAAVSGACIDALAPPGDGHVAITGAGLQARTHLEVLAALGRGHVRVFARRQGSAAALGTWAAQHVPDVEVECVGSAAAAVADAAIVITAVPIGIEGAALDPAWIRPDALVLPLDYATSVHADIANAAALYSDDVSSIVHIRDEGGFPGYRDPDGYTGSAIREPRPEGVVVCQNLGNGVIDLLYADYVLRSAREAGSGTGLAR